MTLPIDQPDFWKNRLKGALRKKAIHKSIYDVSGDAWEKIQTEHRKILSKLVAPSDNVLDAGCGYGALLEVVDIRYPSRYLGVDFSPDLIEQARIRNPSHKFLVADLRKLPFHDGAFTLAIARSVEGMVKDHLGYNEWRKMEAELIRVAGRVLLLNYGEPSRYMLIDSVSEPELQTINRIAMEGGILEYRLGMGNVCEIYNIVVEENQRRKGIGTRLLEGLEKRLKTTEYSSIYLFTKEDNLEAREFYEARGFTGRDLPWFYGGTGAIIYTKTRADV